jgi:hypothetical protein
MNTSAPYTKTAPKTKPTATGIKAHSPLLPYKPDNSAISIAGASKDQYEAAVITCNINQTILPFHLVGIITVYIGNTVHDSNNSYSV